MGEPVAEMLIEPWRVQLLGPLWVTQSSHSISHFRTQKTAALFAFLAYYCGRSHLRAELADLNLRVSRDVALGADVACVVTVRLKIPFPARGMPSVRPERKVAPCSVCQRA